MTTKRIGIHLSTAGGAHTAVERARAAGANTFQIFTSSPRTWRAAPIAADVAAKMRALRAEHDIGPAVIHANYLINLASQTEDVLVKSSIAFRGEVERALALGAEFLVLHPGSWKGLTRDEGLRRAALGIEKAVEGLDFAESNFHLLIENTAGSEHSLGGSFDQVAEMAELLRSHLPVGVCLDTCHTHVAGYDIVSETGWEETVAEIERTIGASNVKVWHCNDAKAARGSKLDRHEHIGEGMIGAGPFRRLLNDPRFAHCAFVAETPVDEPGDIEKNVRALQGLAALGGKK
ncbi:deoxyribonuclease IV [Acidipila sp. EB88]|uniref:deoxyribonuclease IV n=1 Tax=Acidipila sp. EB88 TaxID=2305226 RepID=UPI000F5FD86B|nr:deoxyribonuclease IV [Acidipila sp. EB88]RRA47542.1 deoxyribonuclease IV [Acidipila sp. EB88]